MNNIQFVAPTNLAAQPVHPADATGDQITKINCQHLKQNKCSKPTTKLTKLSATKSSPPPPMFTSSIKMQQQDLVTSQAYNF
jgi:hypothetical protein